MTINNVIPSAMITAGSTDDITGLPFDFEIFNTDELSVTVSHPNLDDPITLNTPEQPNRYTATLVNSALPKSSGRIDFVRPMSLPTEGYFTFLGADGVKLTTEWTLTIRRAVSLDQTTPFNNLGPFLPRTLESALDKVTMLIQDIAEGGIVKIDGEEVIDFDLFGIIARVNPVTRGNEITLQLIYNNRPIGSPDTFTVISAPGGGGGNVDFSNLTLTLAANGVLTLSDGTDSISANLSSLITAHNTSGDAHQDIRNSVGTAVTTHNTAGAAHQDIRDSVSSSVTAHNTDIGAHSDIRSSIGTEITTHNADSSAHQDIRTSIQNIINEGAIPVWEASTDYNLNDIIANAGTLYRVTTAGTSSATFAEDLAGGLDLASITPHRATLSSIRGTERRAAAIYYATDTNEWYFDDGTNLSSVGSDAALRPDLSNLFPPERERLALKGRGLEYEMETPVNYRDLFPEDIRGLDLGVLIGATEYNGSIVYLATQGYRSNSTDRLPMLTHHVLNNIGVIDGELWYSGDIDDNNIQVLFRFDDTGTLERSTLIPSGWSLLDFNTKGNITFFLAKDGTDLMLGRREGTNNVAWRDITTPPGSFAFYHLAIIDASEGTVYLAVQMGSRTNFFFAVWGDSAVEYRSDEDFSLDEVSKYFEGFLVVDGDIIVVTAYFSRRFSPRPIRHSSTDIFSNQAKQDEKAIAAREGDTAVRSDTGEIVQYRNGFQTAGAGVRLQNLATDLTDDEKTEIGTRLGALLGTRPRENQILEGLASPGSNQHVASVSGSVYSGLISSFYVTALSTASNTFTVTGGVRKMKVTYRGQEIDVFLTDNLDQVSLFIDRNANIPFSVLPTSITINIEGGSLGTGALSSTGYLTTAHTYRKGVDTTTNVDADVAIYRGGTGHLNIPVGSQITEITTTGGDLEFDLAPLGEIYGEEDQLYFEYPRDDVIGRVWKYRNGWHKILDLLESFSGKLDRNLSNSLDWVLLSDDDRTSFLETLFRGITPAALRDLHARILASGSGADRLAAFNHLVGTTASEDQSIAVNSSNDDVVWVDNLRTDLSNVDTLTDANRDAFRTAIGIGVQAEGSQPVNLYGTRDPREHVVETGLAPALGKTSGDEGLLLTRADILYRDASAPFSNQVRNINVTHAGVNIDVVIEPLVPASGTSVIVLVPTSVPDDDIPVRIICTINDVDIVFTRLLVSGTVTYTLSDNTTVTSKRVFYNSSPAVVPYQGTLTAISTQDDADAINPLVFSIAYVGAGTIPALEGSDTQLYWQRLERDLDFIGAIWEFKDGGWTKAINFRNNALTTEDPNATSVGAQSYVSNNDTNPAYIFLGDQHAVTSLDDIAWIHHGANYFIDSGQAYYSLRRIKAIHSVLEEKEFAISVIYDAQSRRARLLVMVEDVPDDRNALIGLFHGSSTLYLEDINVTFRYFGDNFDFDMNFGAGDTVNCAVFEYVDRDADGNQIHVNSYEEFLELYQIDKVTKFYFGGTVEDPTGFSPADNIELVHYPGAQVMRMEDDGSYTEYIFANGNYIAAGNSHAPLHSESDTAPVVTKIIRTSGTGPSQGFEGNVIPPVDDRWMLFPSLHMTSSFIVRGTTNTAPTGYASNWNFSRARVDITFSADLEAVLIADRGTGGTLQNLYLLVNRISVENRAAIDQITGLRLRLAGVDYDLPISSTDFVANPPLGTQPFNIDRNTTGTPAPATQITFDISSLPTVNLSGETASLDFQILLTGVPGENYLAAFTRADSVNEHVRVQRDGGSGSTHYNRQTEEGYIKLGDSWRSLNLPIPPLVITNRDTNQTYNINPNNRKIIFDMRASHGSITAVFDSGDHTPGDSWEIERLGEEYLTKVEATGTVSLESTELSSSDLNGIDSALRPFAIHARSHGFIQGTPFQIPSSSSIPPGLTTGNTYWVRDVWDEAFTIVDSFDKVNTGDTSDLVSLGTWPEDGSNVRQTVTFDHLTAHLKIEIAHRPSRYLRHNRQKLIVNYPDHDVRLESNFIQPFGWRSFSQISATGSGNPFSSLTNVRGAWAIDNTHIHFEIAGEVTSGESLDIESLRNHSFNMPFGLSVHNPFRRMFLENPNTGSADRDVGMMVGQVNYQQRGTDGDVSDNWTGNLMIRKDEFNRIHLHSLNSLQDHDNNPSDQNAASGDTVWFSFRVPVSDIS